MKKKIKFLTIVAVLIFAAACSGNKSEKELTTIVFADVSWDSVQVHNRIVAFIIENGFEGYKASYMPGDSIPLVTGILRGDVDVDMESWHSNYLEVYNESIETGDMIDLGPNLPDAPQGWYIPRYLVEGPDALAPGLESIKDLYKYADLFTDPEDPSKGVIYGGVAGWTQITYSEELYNNNNLSETFNHAIAGSNAALAGTMAGAYAKKEPWIGYYWEPTAILGRLDMIRLKGTEYDPALVHKFIGKDMLEKAPDVVELLKKYSTTIADNNAFLAEMEKNKWTTEETAKWFLKNRESSWISWVEPEVAEKVKAAL